MRPEGQPWPRLVAALLSSKTRTRPQAKARVTMGPAGSPAPWFFCGWRGRPQFRNSPSSPDTGSKVQPLQKGSTRWVKALYGEFLHQERSGASQACSPHSPILLSLIPGLWEAASLHGWPQPCGAATTRHRPRSLGRVLHAKLARHLGDDREESQLLPPHSHT